MMVMGLEVSTMRVARESIEPDSIVEIRSIIDISVDDDGTCTMIAPTPIRHWIDVESDDIRRHLHWSRMSVVGSNVGPQ